MAADERRKLCKYCLLEIAERKHRAGCPRAVPKGPRRNQLIREWTEGNELGYNDSRDEDDNYVFSWEVHQYNSPSYRLGYDIGRDDCEDEVYRAFQSNYGNVVDWDDDYVLI